jgi:DNA processing protein
VTKFDLEALIRLYIGPGVGSYRFRILISAFGSPEAVLRAPVQHLMRIQGIDQATARKIKTGIEPSIFSNQMRLIKKHDVDVISFWDNSYPDILKKIYDPPGLLFVKGALNSKDEKAIGIVGTRVPSQYGRMVTEQFCKDLTSHGLTIISGLARGIDTIAHDAALKEKGRTIAVLGCGIDRLYPPENKKLADRIAQNGAVISEYPMGTLPEARNFPKRNRIISGLSLGVLIVEAGKKSGALITAFQALEQNREVFAIPGPINSGKSIGANQLIKEGAKLVQGAFDIIQELSGVLKTSGYTVSSQSIPKLDIGEQLVYDILSGMPMHVDQIARQADKSVPEILSILLTLELYGLVKQLSGKMFLKTS